MVGEWNQKRQVEKVKRYLRGEIAHYRALRTGQLGRPAYLAPYQINAQNWAGYNRLAELRVALLDEARKP